MKGQETGGNRLDLAVLYAEDEQASRERLARILAREVRVLHLAENGREAFDLFERHKPDIIITDVRMPVMDGITLAESIRKNSPRTPVILTTAHGDTEFFLKAIDIGIDKYLLKPVDVSRLIETLHSQMEGLAAARRLAEQSRLLAGYKTAADESSIVLKTGPDGRISYVNKAFSALSGYAPEEVLGKAAQSVGYGRIDGQEEREISGTVLRAGVWKGMLEHTAKDGRAYYTNTTLVPLPGPDGAVSEIIHISHDVTEVMTLNSRLERLSTTDALTQIYNRLKITELLDRDLARARRYGSGFSLVMFDIDHFKRANDTYGHQVGDDILRRVAGLISGRLRKNDAFGRWGGEEFMILTPETALDAACGLAESLRQGIASGDFPAAARVTASFGVAACLAGDNATSLVNRADRALYLAKERGRNRVERL